VRRRNRQREQPAQHGDASQIAIEMRGTFAG
jgi:hypothetical protein